MLGMRRVVLLILASISVMTVDHQTGGERSLNMMSRGISTRSGYTEPLHQRGKTGPDTADYPSNVDKKAMNV